MTIAIRVLYSDLTWVEKPLNEIDFLKKTEILFILLQHIDEVSRVKTNLDFKFGKDNYILSTKRNNGKDWIMLFGYDDDEFTWFDVNCHDCVSGKLNEDPPLSTMHVKFTGISVSTVIWEQAEVKFNLEMTK